MEGAKNALPHRLTIEHTIDKLDYLKKILTFETEFFKQIATFFFLVGSGEVTLGVSFFSSDVHSTTQAIFMVLGSILIGAAFSALREKHKAIYQLLNDLKKD